MVDHRLFVSQCKRLVTLNAGIGFDRAGGDPIAIDGMMHVRNQAHLSPSYAWRTADVEVAETISRACIKRFSSPVVGDADSRLFTLLSREINFILDLQHNLLDPILFHIIPGVPNVNIDGARKALLSVRTGIREENTLLSIGVDRARASEDLLSPAFDTPVEMVAAVVPDEPEGP